MEERRQPVMADEDLREVEVHERGEQQEAGLGMPEYDGGEGQARDGGAQAGQGRGNVETQEAGIQRGEVSQEDGGHGDSDEDQPPKGALRWVRDDGRHQRGRQARAAGARSRSIRTAARTPRKRPRIPATT